MFSSSVAPVSHDHYGWPEAPRFAFRPLGAIIFGMANQGIVYAGWNPDWFFFFLGALLLGAILFNNFIRQRAEASR